MPTHRKTLLMIHAAFGTSASFENFKSYFEARGWDCHAPDLPFHGPGSDDDPALATVSIRDYTDAMAEYAQGLEEAPVIIGHSLGGLIAQQLASRQLARAAILLSPNAPWGILPTSDAERAVAKGLMSAGPFWQSAMSLDFDLEANYALNAFPPEERKSVFATLQRESGQVIFEMFFWMFDDAKATLVDFDNVRCPVLIANGTEDRVLSFSTAEAIAEQYEGRATVYRPKAHGHFLLMEPGWETVARHCERWLGEVLSD